MRQQLGFPQLRLWPGVRYDRRPVVQLLAININLRFAHPPLRPASRRLISVVFPPVLADKTAPAPHLQAGSPPWGGGGGGGRRAPALAPMQVSRLNASYNSYQEGGDVFQLLGLSSSRSFAPFWVAVVDRLPKVGIGVPEGIPSLSGSPAQVGGVDEPAAG